MYHHPRSYKLTMSVPWGTDPELDIGWPHSIQQPSTQQFSHRQRHQAQPIQPGSAETSPRRRLAPQSGTATVTGQPPPQIPTSSKHFQLPSIIRPHVFNACGAADETVRLARVAARHVRQTKDPHHDIVDNILRNHLPDLNILQDALTNPTSRIGRKQE